MPDGLIQADSPGWWTFPGLNRGALLQVNGRFQCNDTETLLDAAVAGLGIVHPTMCAMVGLCNCFLPRTVPRSRGAPAIYAVRLPGRSHAARARLFLDHVRAHIGAPPYWDHMAGDIRPGVRQANPDSSMEARRDRAETGARFRSGTPCLASGALHAVALRMQWLDILCGAP
jgi:hypothetical protein